MTMSRYYSTLSEKFEDREDRLPENIDDYLDSQHILEREPHMSLGRRQQLAELDY
jgi:hypothetical protein